MNKYFVSCIAGLSLTGALIASENLYTIGPAFNAPAVDDESSESLPINWNVGADFTYDDNLLPGSPADQDSFGISPYISAGFLSVGPQTTIDIFARLGMVYYFDAPAGMDDTNSSSKLHLNIKHEISERVSFATKNHIAYELEPNYAYGYASSRQGQEHLYWMTDNSLGYRWTERLGTSTGVKLSGLQYQDVSNQDRTTWQLYNQFRYVLTPQSIATFDYRYGVTTADGIASDSTNQFILAGIEHRFSPNTVGTFKAGVQIRDVDKGDSASSPYFEGSVQSQVNEQFRVRAFTRYGIESYDTVQSFATAPGGLVEYDERNTMRFGLSSNYRISPFLTFFSGVDYITTSYESGRIVASGNSFGDSEEDFITAHVGLSYQLKEGLTGTATYTYTGSNSDIANRTYDRNRISVGINSEF